MSQVISNDPKDINFKAILPLAMINLVVYLASTSVAFKMIHIGPLLLPGPPFIFPVTYAIGDIIAEVYGYKISRSIIYYTLVFQFLFAFLIFFVINLPSPKAWSLDVDYQVVFGHIIRFVSSGFVAVLLSSLFNIFLFSKIKVLMKGKKFWVRNLVASAAGGFVLVFIIIVFAYSAVLNLKQMLHMFTSIYILEFLYSCILIWPALKISGFLKLIEKIDVYDHNLKITNLFK